MGERSPGECEFDAMAEPESNSSASDAFLDRAPIRLFFSLNFSNQLELSVTSGDVVVVENARACRRINSSVSGLPFFSCSCMSVRHEGSTTSVAYLIPRPVGERPLDVGRAALWSLCRRSTAVFLLKQVLLLLPQHLGNRAEHIVSIRKQASGLWQLYLRSTPNIAANTLAYQQNHHGDTQNSLPISVCLLLGCSSAYWHIRFRSKSVSVFRGVDADLVEVADTGVCRGPADNGWID